MTLYYEDDLVSLYHGDAERILPRLSIAVPARLITDPPYGAGTYKSDVAPRLQLLPEWVSRFSTVAIFGYPEQLAFWCSRTRVSPDEWVTWWPTNTIGGQRRSQKLPRESECVAIFGEVPGGQRLFRPRSLDDLTRTIAVGRGHDPEMARQGDVWRDPSPGAGFNHHLRRHPNEKPLSLMEKLVQLCSDPGEVILDPYAGSGTTLEAAKKLGRRAIGIEIEEKWCKIAAERCAQDVMEVA
jgi:hypothetical protein